MKTVGIIGLGYVGLPLAVKFGEIYKTIGYDINISRIQELRSGFDRTLELEISVVQNSKLLTFTDNYLDIAGLDVYIITVPTPIDKVNRPDLGPLILASETVAKVMKKGAVVIYESTVYPGCTEEICVKILEQFSGLIFNKDFYCGYSPERINPADKINTIDKIIKITSGSTPEIADFVDKLYSTVVKAGTYKAKSIKIAEAAKVIENVQRDLNIALINELSIIFDKLGMDTMQVIEAASTKWNFLQFRPGLVGGHCIGVDPYYLTHKAQEVGYHPQVILAGRRINDDMAIYAANKIVKIMTQNELNINKSRIGVLGVTFKENCPDIRNSKVFDLIKELKSWGAELLISDYYANPNEVLLEYGVNLVSMLEINHLDVLIVAVGHADYRELSCSNIAKRFRSVKPIIADIKSIYCKDELIENGIIVYRM